MIRYMRLWKNIRGFGIRSIDDSKEGVERFSAKRNPTTSVVAEEEWQNCRKHSLRA